MSGSNCSFWPAYRFLRMQVRWSGIWSLVPLPFLNAVCISGSSRFTYCWSLVWRILRITLLACEMSTIYGSLYILLHCLSLGLEWKLTFSSPVTTHCWVFQICWHIEWSTFTASSFRIWNSSAGISLPLLALFLVMLAKAHLISNS